MTEVRAMREDDIPFVAAIELECFTQPWSAAGLASELKKENARMFVACVGNEIAGWAGLEYVLDEGSITNVAVLTRFRRNRAGDAMVRRLIEEAVSLGLQSVTLEVRCSNEPAIALYDKLGFENIGVRPNFYDYPSEDAVMMRLNLEGKSS